MSDPTSRALALLAMLQTHRHWSGPDLAERLGVSERTVRRDVDRLRELGYPILASPGVDGGYQLAAGSHVPPLVVDDDEAVALAVGLRAAAGAAISGIEETTIRVIAKLEQLLPDHLRRRVDALNANLDVLRWTPSTTVAPASLAVLAQGCRDCEEVRFDYTRRDGEEAARLVRPHQLVSVGHRWYLVAWDVRRADWRTFRVDRMTEPRLAGARFEPQELPAGSAGEFVAAGLSAMALRHEAIVRLDAPPDRLEAVQRWFGSQMTCVDDDPSTVRLRADAAEWLASMIAILATSFAIEIVEADDGIRALVAATADRLAVTHR